MATLQVKSLPDDLYAELQRRARDEGTTVSDYVTRMLRRELAKPTLAEWLAEMPDERLGGDGIDTVTVLDEIRGPWE
jgi:antitoxin FitA